MRSLLFWRKKESPAHGAPVASPTAAPPSPPAPPVEQMAAPTATDAVPLPRRLFAMALGDERAVDMAARPDAAHTQLLLAASREFARIGTEAQYTPHRPSLLPQLLEVLNDEDASLRALSRIVAQDPQLTGELLRTANSPLYRISPTPVESVERAAALLGTQGIRSLIASRLLQPLTGTGGKAGQFGEYIWEHSLYSASAAEAWASRSGDADPFTAHLLALLHGLGCVSVYRALADLYAAQPGLQPDPAVLAGALHDNAALAAARIAASWGMSDRTRLALEAQSAAAPARDPDPLAQALQFGLLGGTLALLCRHGRMTEEEAAAQLAAAGFTGTQPERVWDRLVRAYVRP